MIPQVDVGTVSLPGDDRITYPGGITIDRPGRVLSGPLTVTPSNWAVTSTRPTRCRRRSQCRPACLLRERPGVSHHLRRHHGSSKSYMAKARRRTHWGLHAGVSDRRDPPRRSGASARPSPRERPPFTPTPAQPTPAFLPPGTSAYPPSMPRAVEAGPRVDFAAYGTPTDQGVAMPPANRAMPWAPDGPPAAPPGPVPSPTPRGAAGAEPIMSAADIQARARGHFSAADQAAAQGSMLPDENAAAVRKIFSDAIPTDQEQARIVVARPTVQAAKNVECCRGRCHTTPQ